MAMLTLLPSDSNVRPDLSSSSVARVSPATAGLALPRRVAMPRRSAGRLPGARAELLQYSNPGSSRGVSRYEFNPEISRFFAEAAEELIPAVAELTPNRHFYVGPSAAVSLQDAVRKGAQEALLSCLRKQIRSGDYQAISVSGLGDPKCFDQTQPDLIRFKSLVALALAYTSLLAPRDREASAENAVDLPLQVLGDRDVMKAGMGISGAYELTPPAAVLLIGGGAPIPTRVYVAEQSAAVKGFTDARWETAVKPRFVFHYRNAQGDPLSIRLPLAEQVKLSPQARLTGEAAEGGPEAAAGSDPSRYRLRVDATKGAVTPLTAEAADVLKVMRDSCAGEERNGLPTFLSNNGFLLLNNRKVMYGLGAPRSFSYPFIAAKMDLEPYTGRTGR